MYDLIGDIHGHADELRQLLQKLGYHKSGDAWRHPERKVIFLGDFIDRGPQIRETLELVRSMVDQGHALAVMGNHEYNALAFNLEHPGGGHLRPHTIKNVVQHYQTMHQFKNRQRECDDYLEWFMTLPLFLELDSFNAVHACWDQGHIDFLKATLTDNRIDIPTLRAAAERGSELYNAIEDTLKGKELRMPEGLSFTDKDGMERFEIRVKWWQDPRVSTWRSYSVVSLPQLPELAVAKEFQHSYYSETDKPVFFGHYWLEGEPFLYRDNICCLDYSIAKQGRLAAYRWNPNEKLSTGNFFYISYADQKG